MPAAPVPRAVRTPRVVRRRHRLDPAYLAERQAGREGPDLAVLEELLAAINAGEQLDVQLLCFQWPNWPVVLGPTDPARVRVGAVELFDALGLPRTELLACFAPEAGPVLQGVFTPGGEQRLATLLRTPLRVIRTVFQDGELILLGATPVIEPERRD